MKRTVVIILAALLCLAQPCFAEVDFGAGVDFSTWGPYGEKRDKKDRPTEPFIAALAQHFKCDRNELMKLWYRGYGRNELIKLLLISGRSGKDLKELVKQRDKGEKLSGLAKKYAVDWDQVVAETQVLRKEIDADSLTVSISSFTFAASSVTAPSGAPVSTGTKQ